MERRQLILLVIISFLLCNVVAYLDEGIRTFEYLTMPGDWIALIIYTIVFMILPLILFLSFRKSKLKFRIALVGFAPVILLILGQIQ
ncbi:hypothetical protein [Winogradskyella sp. 3972H.M.0a.05]|uniref:hypothetical protein n=1 Tax=Winogradskyella sp. 3972H.M.0a.05 TaxID=2950277 RepID=UPI00339756A6